MYEPNPGAGQPPGQQPFPPQGHTPPQQVPPTVPAGGATPPYGPPPGGDINLGAVPPAPPPKRGRTGLIIALSGVVALALVGGGVYAGVSYFGEGESGTSTEHLPGSTQAFAEFNLDVSGQQQSRLADVAEKFPKLKETGDPQKLVSDLLSQIEDEEADFKDGKFSEWVGLGASIGLWEHDGKPTAVVALPSTDDAKAKAGLKKVKESSDGEMGFVVEDGYATLAGGDDIDGTAAAKAAASEAKKSPLSDEKKFAEAAKWMEDDQVLTGWADLEAVNQTLKNSAGEGMGGDPMGMFNGMLQQQDSAMKGQVALGGQAIDGGVELRTKTFGAGEAYEGSPELSGKLGEQPTGDVALAAMLPDDITKSAAGGLLSMFVAPTTDGDELPPEVQQILEALAGSTVTVSVSGIAEGQGQGQGTIETTSPENAEALAALESGTGGYLDLSAEGKTVTGSTAGYQAPQGKLADEKYFKQGFEDVPEELNLALYLNLDSVIPESEKELGAMKAATMAQGTEGGETVSTMRLFVG